MNDVRIDYIHETVGKIDSKLDKINDRVSSLEIWRAGIIAKMSLLTGFITIGLSFIWHFFKDKIKL